MNRFERAIPQAGDHRASRAWSAVALATAALSSALLSAPAHADEATVRSSDRYLFADRTTVPGDLAQTSDPAVRNSATSRPEPAVTPERRRRDWDEEMASRKSYAIPPLEIIGFDVLLNRVDRVIYGPDSEYNVTSRSIRDNLRSRWVVDSDPFSINQFLHPYQGSMYYGFARSAIRSPAVHSGKSSVRRRRRRATTRSPAESEARFSARPCIGCRTSCSSASAGRGG